MSGIPSDIGDCIDCSLCAYTGYFPNLLCILHIHKECGTKNIKILFYKEIKSNVLIRERDF